MESATEAVIERAPVGTPANWTGRQVRHAVFGLGRVDDQEGSGPEARLAVFFPKAGRRKIVARYLELVP